MGYGIPREKGGDSPENVEALERKLVELRQTNGHLDEDVLIRIGMDMVFGTPETGQKWGGQ